MIVSYINFLYSFDYIKISINDEQLEKELIYFNFQFFFCSCFFFIVLKVYMGKRVFGK